MQASFRNADNPALSESDFQGFRVATVPEPSTFALASLGVLGLFALRKRRRLSCAALLLPTLATMFAATESFAAAPRYHLTVLQALGDPQETLPYAISNQGQIVGGSAVPNVGVRAFLYDAGTVTNLGVFGGNYSEARGINDNGQVVGFSTYDDTGFGHAFSYSGGTMTDLGTLGGIGSLARGVNNLGQVVGNAQLPNFRDHPFLYSAGTITDLNPLGVWDSGAYDINDTSQVVGAYVPAGFSGNHGFLYSGGVLTDLGTLGNNGSESYARAINDQGQIVGYSELANSLSTHAFLYSSGHMTDLGTLGGTRSQAFAINNGGQIVGKSFVSGDNSNYFGFLHSDGVMSTLTTLLDSASAGWIVNNTTGINDSGWIVGTAYNPSLGLGTSGVLLTPVPEPSTFALAALGILGVVAYARRRARSSGGIECWKG
jgi:probable HAF family extracellular repeat protein